MPGRYDLPEELRGIAQRNAVRLDHETFRSDVVTLLDAVQRLLPTSAKKAAESTVRTDARAADQSIDKEHADRVSEANNSGWKLAKQRNVDRVQSFDAGAVDCRVTVFPDGLATSFLHDPTLQVTSLSLDVGADDGITADFDPTSLKVTTDISASDRKDIEKNVDKVLESRKHSKIQFRSVSVVRNGHRARIEGDLTLHGVTSPISVEAHDDGERWNAKIILDQRQFGIKPFSVMFGALKVKPEVEVNISVPHP